MQAICATNQEHKIFAQRLPVLKLSSNLFSRPTGSTIIQSNNVRFIRQGFQQCISLLSHDFVAVTATRPIKLSHTEFPMARKTLGVVGAGPLNPVGHFSTHSKSTDLQGAISANTWDRTTQHVLRQNQPRLQMIFHHPAPPTTVFPVNRTRVSLLS